MRRWRTRSRAPQLGAYEELDILAHARVQILEGLEVKLPGITAEVLPHLRAKVAIGEREHPAVGMMDDRHLGGAEQAL
jgi:hypothetical protein